MTEKCLAGINIISGEVDWVCTIDESVEITPENLNSIEEDGCYTIIADKELADEALGKKIDSPQDIVRVAGQSPKQGQLL